MLSKLVALANAAVALMSFTTPALAASASEAAAPPEAMMADDECLGRDAQCSLSALQHRAALQSTEGDAGLAAGNTSGLLQDGDASNLTLQAGWRVGGDKVWGSGSGIESVSSSYCDSGFAAAHSHCGGAGCALMINPPGHRSINHIHIHFAHYHGSYSANLIRRLESSVCHSSSWHSGFPCGGKAKFYPGFPGACSAAASQGSLSHATVVAWPGACGGSGTIVEVGYHCSIEHQIRGDFHR